MDIPDHDHATIKQEEHLFILKDKSYKVELSVNGKRTMEMDTGAAVLNASVTSPLDLLHDFDLPPLFFTGCMYIVHLFYPSQ